MSKKNIVLGLSITLLIALIFFLIFFQDKKLDITSQKVQDLYSILGDVNNCGGLITYSDKTMTINELDKDNQMCRSYYNITDETKIKVNELKPNDKDENNNAICRVGEKAIFSPSEVGDCTYEEIDASVFSNASLHLYGEKIETDEMFYVDNKKACYKENDKYYCGEAVNYKISISSEIENIRIIDKVIEKLDNSIIIYDYFLKISNNTCYNKNNGEENADCTKALKNIKLDDDNEIIKLLKKYGTIYKHTFKENKNDNTYYWVKTELK